MKTTLDIDDKYSVIIDLENGRFYALRYGEQWRNLIGDKFILSLVYKIMYLQEELELSKNQ